MKKLNKITIFSFILAFVFAAFGLFSFFHSDYYDRLSAKLGYAGKGYNHYLVNSWKNSLNGVTSDTVFVGDSITAQGDWYEKYGDDIRVLAVPGCRIKEGIQLSEIAVTLSPKKVFVLIGVNNISTLNYEDAIRRDYGELLDVLCESNAKIYVESILPVCEPSSVSNDRIRSANAILEDLAKEHGCEFLDIFDNFLDDSAARLDKELTKDGIHLNDAGYQVLMNSLDSFIKE